MRAILRALNHRGAASTLKGLNRRVASHTGSGVLIAYIALFAFLSFASPYFLTLDNVVIVLRQAVFVALMAIGMTFVIGMGGIDLSVGAILGISGVAVAALIQGGVNINVAVVLALIFGALLGAVNGTLITYFRLAPFIATLGTMSVLRGLIMVYTQGIPIYGLRYPEFQFLGQGFIGFIPVPVAIAVVLVVVFRFILYSTRLGRYTLSIGSNPTAARLAGININRVKMIVYSMTGLLCAAAGIFVTSRSEAAVPDAGLGLELDVIAATVIGGTSMIGGRANLVGTVIGAVLMTTIRNGLNLLGISPLWHQVVIGGFIVFAVAISSMSASKSTD
jgi:ribose transport system permease protein